MLGSLRKTCLLAASICLAIAKQLGIAITSKTQCLVFGAMHKMFSDRQTYMFTQSMIQMRTQNPQGFPVAVYIFKDIGKKSFHLINRIAQPSQILYRNSS